MDEIQDSIEEGLQKTNDQKLFQTYQEWLKINEKRENKMLQNIYTYSENNTFNKAIFMVGFGHRKSIMQKIAKFEKRSDVNINWTCYKNTFHYNKLSSSSSMSFYIGLFLNDTVSGSV